VHATAIRLDADAVQRWMVPDGMTSDVHEFDGREGGRWRITLTYDEPTGTGKTTSHSDTHGGVFVRLVPDSEVVQSVTFETNDPALQGEMTITYRDDGDGGTIITGTHEGLPDAVDVGQNEEGWRTSLDKLAAVVEGRD
jgi:uncharacterized protein YndB with AHSA1/START domain